MHVRTRKRLKRFRARLIGGALTLGVIGAGIASVAPTLTHGWFIASHKVVAGLLMLPVNFVQQVIIG